MNIIFNTHSYYGNRCNIRRNIFGPTRTDDRYWRIKTIQGINDILKGQNITGFIKKQRLNWLGHKSN
jgi:hypothetical protein